jgi:hypothetical protein
MIFKPLETLDEAIKNNAKLNPYYKKILVYIVNKLKDVNYTNLYYIFQLLPRIILIIALCIDIFYFHKIHLLYKVIIISILLVISKYIIYSFKYSKEQYILRLEYMLEGISTDYQEPDEEYPGMFLNLVKPRRFLDLQIFAMVYEDKTYRAGPISNKNYRAEYRKLFNLSKNDSLTSKHYDIMYKEYYEIMEVLIPMCIHIEEYEFRNEFKRIKRMKIVIFSLFAICWIYIIIKSFHTLPDNSFTWLWKILDIIEPFSNTTL